jgi:hypothetical protein
VIIAFAWTTPALLAGQKTVTRRDWSRTHAERVAAAFRRGETFDAYDKSPRFKGRKVATIRLTREPYIEMSNEIPDADWYGEGFEFAMAHGLKFENKVSAREVWDFWQSSPHPQWVVRFEVVSLEEGNPAHE